MSSQACNEEEKSHSQQEKEQDNGDRGGMHNEEAGAGLCE